MTVEEAWDLLGTAVPPGVAMAITRLRAEAPFKADTEFGYTRGCAVTGARLVIGKGLPSDGEVAEALATVLNHVTGNVDGDAASPASPQDAATGPVDGGTRPCAALGATDGPFRLGDPITTGGIGGRVLLGERGPVGVLFTDWLWRGSADGVVGLLNAAVANARYEAGEAARGEEERLLLDAAHGVSEIGPVGRLLGHGLSSAPANPGSCGKCGSSLSLGVCRQCQGDGG